MRHVAHVQLANPTMNVGEQINLLCAHFTGNAKKKYGRFIRLAEGR
jgi:hypothetical protein